MPRACTFGAAPTAQLLEDEDDELLLDEEDDDELERLLLDEEEDEVEPIHAGTLRPRDDGIEPVFFACLSPPLAFAFDKFLLRSSASKPPCSAAPLGDACFSSFSKLPPPPPRPPDQDAVPVPVLPPPGFALALGAGGGTPCAAAALALGCALALVPALAEPSRFITGGGIFFKS